MFEALYKRLDQIKRVRDEAALNGAIAIAELLRADVKRSHRAAQGRRKARRTELRTRGFSAKEAASRVRMGAGRKSSGVSIIARSAGTAIIVSASNQVQYFARAKSEIQQWIAIVAREVRAVLGSP